MEKEVRRERGSGDRKQNDDMLTNEASEEWIRTGIEGYKRNCAAGRERLNHI